MKNKLEHQVLFAVYTVALKHTGIVLLIRITPLNFQLFFVYNRTKYYKNNDNI